MNTKELKEFLMLNKGKFFTVEFVKKDGTLRTLNGHIGYVPGHDGVNPVAHIDKYVTVVESKPNEDGSTKFRNVNLQTIKSLRIAGKRFDFDV